MRIKSGKCAYSMQITAKFLGIGSKILFKNLRDKNILCEANTPYKKYIDQGFFVIELKKRQMGDDSFHVYKKTLVTRKGITWLREILIEGQKAEKICTMNHYKSVE